MFRMSSSTTRTFLPASLISTGTLTPSANGRLMTATFCLRPASAAVGANFSAGDLVLDSAEPLDEASAGVPDHATTGLAMGRYSVKVLPTPGWLSSVISPASRRVSSRQMDRPSPVPPYLRLGVPSPCA